NLRGGHRTDVAADDSPVWMEVVVTHPGRTDAALVLPLMLWVVDSGDASECAMGAEGTKRVAPLGAASDIHGPLGHPPPAIPTPLNALWHCDSFRTLDNGADRHSGGCSLVSRHGLRGSESCDAGRRPDLSFGRVRLESPIQGVRGGHSAC